MYVSEASLWFNSVPLDGWDGTAWYSKVAYGDFHAFDRFITERTFGAKKRIFHTPEETKIDYASYPIVRTPDGKVWLITSDNADIEGTEAYAQSYLLLEASLQGQIIEHTTQLLSSGAQGPDTETVVATEYCDLERYSASNSDMFANVTYGGYEITFRSGAAVTVENEILIDGVYYEVKEKIPELLTTVCRCLKRG
jgi:hypothetical protein